MIKQGEKALDFELPDQDGRLLRLADFRGQRVVVYFYPKADTRGTIGRNGNTTPGHRHRPRFQVKGREGESFASPAEQRERIEAACERDGLRLIDTLNELDVSGGTPLDQRVGLRSAVERIEAGEASVIVAAYFDRLVRSLKVQGELLERVEAAGGQVLAVDIGQVTEDTAGQWLSGTIHGAMNEYVRRAAQERSGDAQRRAVARGVLPWPNIPPGYRRGDDGVLVTEPTEAAIVAGAFQLRAGGASVREVREYLREQGIDRSHHGTSHLLQSRVVLGEIHFGKLINEAAHPAIVDRDVWTAVQRARATRGRRAKSARLLARLGVLRCGSCGARMVIGSANNGQYMTYRCPPNGDCKRRVTISADHAEQTIADATRTALADVEGRASAESNVKDAEHALDQAEQALATAVETLTGFEDVPTARARLTDLREARDTAQERLDELGGTAVAVTVTAGADWDQLTLDGKRALIRAVVRRAVVAPGTWGRSNQR